MNNYVVVFEYTEAAGDYRGVRTWTTYSSKEEFNKQRGELLSRGRERVLAEGISPKEAVALVWLTPLACSLRVCIAEATGKDGTFYPRLFLANVKNVLFVEAFNDAA